ncbi:hypothetical protein RI054_05g30080 [Pseudoscourfieldia marina]
MATEAHVRGASALDALAGRLTQNILYVWGPNEQVAASAASAELDGQPAVGARARAIVAGFQINSVSIGTDHGVAVDDDGRLVAWGADDAGQLGLTFDEGGDWPDNEVSSVGSGKTPSKRRDRAASTSTSASAHLARPAPRLVSFVNGRLMMERRQPRGQQRLPFLHPYFDAPTRRVRCVACGHNFTLVVLRDFPGLLSWGVNGNGQLGFDDTTSRRKPEPVAGTKLERAVLVQLAAGHRHSAAIDHEGNCWTWGCGSSAQLGRMTKQTQGTPAQVKGIVSAAVVVSCGYDHTVAVGANGRAYCWGGNTHAQCAVADATDVVPVPTVVKEFLASGALAKRAHTKGQDLRVVNASAGTRVTAFVDEHGMVYMCGAEVPARIAVNAPDEKPRFEVASQPYNMVPPGVTASRDVGMITWLADDPVTSVALAETHAVALHASTQKPLCWGNAIQGRFGVGEEDDGVIRRLVPGDSHAPSFHVQYSNPKGVGLEYRKMRAVSAGKYSSASIGMEESYVCGTKEFLLCVRFVIAYMAKINAGSRDGKKRDDNVWLDPSKSEAEFVVPFDLQQWMMMLREIGVLSNNFTTHDGVAIYDSAILYCETKRIESARRKYKETLRAFDDELALMDYEDTEEWREIETQYHDQAPKAILQGYEERKQNRAVRREELKRQQANFHSSVKLDPDPKRSLDVGEGLELALFQLAARLNAPDLERDTSSWFFPQEKSAPASTSSDESSSKKMGKSDSKNARNEKGGVASKLGKLKRLPSIMVRSKAEKGFLPNEDEFAKTKEPMSKVERWARQTELGGTMPAVLAMLDGKDPKKGTTGIVARPSSAVIGRNSEKSNKTVREDKDEDEDEAQLQASGGSPPHVIERVTSIKSMHEESWLKHAKYSLSLARYQSNPDEFELTKEERQILGDDPVLSFDTVDRAPPASEWPIRILMSKAIVPTLELRISYENEFSPLTRCAYHEDIRRFMEEPETHELLLQVWMYLQESSIADEMTPRTYMRLRATTGGVRVNSAVDYLGMSVYDLKMNVKHEHLHEQHGGEHHHAAGVDPGREKGPSYKTILALMREAELIPKKVFGTRKSEGFASIDRQVALRSQKERNAHRTLRIPTMGKYPTRGYRFPRDGEADRMVTFVEFSEMIVHCALMWPLRKIDSSSPSKPSFAPGIGMLGPVSSVMTDGGAESEDGGADDNDSSDDDWESSSRPGTSGDGRSLSTANWKESLQSDDYHAHEVAVRRIAITRKTMRLSNMFSSATQASRSERWYRNPKTGGYVLDIRDNLYMRKSEENTTYYAAEEASRHKLRPIPPEEAYADSIDVDGSPTVPLQRIKHVINRLLSWRNKLVDPTKAAASMLKSVEDLNKEVQRAFSVYCGLGESTHRVDVDQARWRRFSRDIKVIDGINVDSIKLDNVFNEISRERVGLAAHGAVSSSVNSKVAAELAGRVGRLNESWDEEAKAKAEEQERLEKARAATAMVQGTVEVSKDAEKLVKKHQEDVESTGVKAKDVGRGVVKAALDKDQFRGAILAMSTLKYPPVPLKFQKAQRRGEHVDKASIEQSLHENHFEGSEEEREQEMLEDEMHLATRVMGIGIPISAEESFRWLVELHLVPAVKDVLDRYDRYVGQLDDVGVNALVKSRQESIKLLFTTYAKLDGSLGYSAAETQWELLQNANNTVSFKELRELCMDKKVVPDLLSRRELEMAFRRANFGTTSVGDDSGSKQEGSEPNVEGGEVDEGDRMASGLTTTNTDENWHDLTLIEFVGALGIVSQMAFADSTDCQTAADRFEKLLDWLGCHPPKKMVVVEVEEEKSETEDPYAHWWRILPAVRGFADAKGSNIWYYANSKTMPVPMIRETLRAPHDLPPALSSSVELAQTYLARGMFDDSSSIIDAVEQKWADEVHDRGLTADGYISPQGRLFILSLRGLIHEGKGNHDEAAELYMSAIQDLCVLLSPSSPDALLAYGCYGRTCLHLKRYERAFVSCVYHLVGLESIEPGPHGVEAATARANLAFICDVVGEAKVAVQELRIALEDLTAHLGEAHPRVRAVAIALERVLHKRYNAETAAIARPLDGPSEAARRRVATSTAHYEPVVHLKPKERANLGLPPLGGAAGMRTPSRGGARSATPTTGMRAGRAGLSTPSTSTRKKAPKKVHNPTFDDPLVDFLATAEKSRAWHATMGSMAFVQNGYGGGAKCLRSLTQPTDPFERTTQAARWASPDPSVPPPTGVMPRPSLEDPKVAQAQVEAARQAELEKFDEGMYAGRLHLEARKQMVLKIHREKKAYEKEKARKKAMLQKMRDKERARREREAGIRR